MWRALLVESMETQLSQAKGFTLMEVAVMLAVLSVLAGLTVGMVGNVVEDGQVIRAREEVGQIGRAVTSFYADTGQFPQTLDGSQSTLSAQLIGLLASSAAMPDVTDGTALWVQARADRMDAHLAANYRGYTPRSELLSHGWNGPYLAPELGDDPWGRAYLINVFYRDARDALVEADGTPLGAVYAISAGPNGVIETPYYQRRDSATIFGDDIGFRLQ